MSTRTGSFLQGSCTRAAGDMARTCQRCKTPREDGGRGGHRLSPFPQSGP